MEVLELPGYVDEDKLQIAERYLLPKQADANGVKLGSQIQFTPEALLQIIREHTHEAGVRRLEQCIAAICRKRARQMAEDGPPSLVVSPQVVSELLGAAPYRLETQLATRTRRPGVAVAVAWTPYGGDILFVESTRMPRDQGEFTVTGQLGEVMRESAKAALSWVRANAGSYGIDDAALRSSDVHLHVPSGAVPKDGPSAGIAMVVSLVSLFQDKPVRPYVAMSGEITLSGVLLPVGGIKEKVLAARRSGVRDLVLPQENEAHVREQIPARLRSGLVLHFASTMSEVLDIALGPTSAAPGEPNATPASARS
jgi:ATP-dependent Lon protease